MNIYRRYSERTPLKEDLEHKAQRRRKLGMAAITAVVLVVTGQGIEAAGDVVDLLKNTYIWQTNGYEPGEPVINQPLLEPENGVMN
ncbi:MAG TPA: hypothetical protein VLA77_01865 [Candidatus Saccharimonadales bacterium]|nr:hypothetical protein [Candidatus Saccharimonadales bacterium]